MKCPNTTLCQHPLTLGVMSPLQLAKAVITRGAGLGVGYVDSSLLSFRAYVGVM